MQLSQSGQFNCTGRHYSKILIDGVTLFGALVKENQITRQCPRSCCHVRHPGHVLSKHTHSRASSPHRHHHAASTQTRGPCIPVEPTLEMTHTGQCMRVVVCVCVCVYVGVGPPKTSCHNNESAYLIRTCILTCLKAFPGLGKSVVWLKLVFVIKQK